MEGHISPFLGMWGPNILFLLAGLYLFARTARESPLFTFFSRKGRKKRARMVMIKLPVSFRARRWAAGRRPWFSLRFPNILDRYIMRKYLAIFVLVFLALVSISVIVTFFERIDNIYEHNKSLSLLFRYIQYRIPEFMNYCLPVAVLATALLTIGLMTKSNEITAMKACGLSIYRLVLSLVVTAGVVSLFSFGLQERLVPSANKKAEEVWNQINEVPHGATAFLIGAGCSAKIKVASTTIAILKGRPGPSANSPSSTSTLVLVSGQTALCRKGASRGHSAEPEPGWSRSFPGESRPDSRSFWKWNFAWRGLGLFKQGSQRAFHDELRRAQEVYGRNRGDGLRDNAV